MPKQFAAAAPDVSTSRARPAAGLPPGFVEALERRELLSVSTDADGWTVITPGKGDRVIYVSSSSGDDDRGGTSPSSPIKTLHEGVSRLRDGTGDQLLLKSGDVWREPFGVFRKSGRSASEPLVIGSYGSGDRPRIETGSATGLLTGSSSAPDVRNLALVGLHFHAHTRDHDSPSFNPQAAGSTPNGLRLTASSNNILIEDCRVEAYATNVVVEQAGFGPIRNVTIRRSVIVDAYSPTMHAQGLYAEGVDGLTLEENVFDHNGWDDRVPGGRATIYNHNAYVNSSNSNFVAKGNVFANGGSHGLQARAGGQVLDNFFYGNPLGLSYGLVNGSTVKPGGVSGVVNGNVFIGTRDISGAPRGMGIEIGNTRAGEPTVVSNNVFDNDAVVNAGQNNPPPPGESGDNPAIMLVYGKANSNADEAAGLNDLSVQGNIVHRWNAGLSVAAGIEPGGRGPRALNRVSVRRNDFQRIRGSLIVKHFGAMEDSHERWSGNRYDADESDRVVLVGGRGVSLSSWSDAHERDAKAVRPPYVDAGRSVGSYERTLAASDATAEGTFLAGARGLSRGNWQPQFTARAMIDYVRTGFEEQGAPPRDWRAPTPPTATAALPQSVTTADTGLTFTVTYADDKGMDIASLDSEDVRLVRQGGNGGPRLAAALLSAQAGPEGTVIATYRVEAPRTVWRRQDRGRYAVVVSEGQVRDVEGFSMPAGPVAEAPLDVTEVPPPPQVKKVKFRAKAPQALTFTFTSDVVGANLRPASLVLTREDGAVLDATAFAVTYDAETRSATWTFPALPGGILPAGRYRASLLSADVADAEARPLDGNRDGLGGDDFLWAKTIKAKG